MTDKPKDETKPVTYWGRAKAWANSNPVLAGALAGGAAGTVVPGVGNVIGVLGGAAVGYLHGKDKKTGAGE